MILVVFPLTGLSIVIILAESIENAMGSRVQTLLQSGLRTSEMGSLLFFGSLVIGVWCCCLSQRCQHAAADANSSQSTTRGDKWSSNISPGGQMAAVCGGIFGALWGLLLLMFLDERLFTGTIIDEVIQGSIFVTWGVVVILIVTGLWRVEPGDKTIFAWLWSAVVLSILWLTARVCVMHVMGRVSGLPGNDWACMAFIALHFVNELCISSIRMIHKVRLRKCFLSDAKAATVRKPLGFESSTGMPMAVAKQHTEDMNIGDLYYGRTPQPRLSLQDSSAPISSSRAAIWKLSDPPITDLNSQAHPYFLINTVASGYIRTPLHSYGLTTVRDGDLCSFLLSPAYCGSDRTGFFPTPSGVSLSDAMAMCAGAESWSPGTDEDEAPSQSRIGLLSCWIGGWFQIPRRQNQLWLGVAAAGETNPTPNFFLDPTGSKPISRKRKSSSVLPIPWPSWSLSVLIRQGGWPGILLLLLCSLMLSFYDSGFVWAPASIVILILFISLTPEGHPFLAFRPVRAMHRAMGAVHTSEHPPPYLHLSDNRLDPLGLQELLKRRCTTIFVCDSMPDPFQECSTLLQVLERSRTEFGCAFLPPVGCSGDVSTLVREFQVCPHKVWGSVWH